MGVEIQKNEKGTSTINKFCNCCFQKTHFDLEFDEETNKSDNYPINSKMIYDNELSLFPNNMIRPEEKNILAFTKDALVEYINNLQNLVYPNIYNNKGIKISKRNYSDINGKLPLLRFEILKQKSFFTKVPSIQKVIDVIRKPELRKKWDKNIKEYKIVEKMKKNSEIIRTVTNKQLSVISEKEFYDKRVGFFKDNIYYLFSSAIPNELYPINNNYDRGKNILSIMIIKEDNNYFYFDCFNQIDININIPIEFIESYLFKKLNSFFDKYFNFLNALK